MNTATSANAAGDTAAFGGLVARWSEEAAAVNPTEPAFRQVTLTARELSGYAKVSNTLVDDAGAGLEALLVALFGGAIAWHEDSAFLRGDGVGKPLGAVGPATGAAVAVTRKTLNRFVLDDAAKMLARFMPGWSPARACWVMHPSVYSELLLMSDATNLVFLPDARGQADEKSGMVAGKGGQIVRRDFTLLHSPQASLRPVIQRLAVIEPRKFLKFIFHQPVGAVGQKVGAWMYHQMGNHGCARQRHQGGDQCDQQFFPRGLQFVRTASTVPNAAKAGAKQGRLQQVVGQDQ